MLIKESELIKNTNDILSQLNEAVYLTQEESQIHASEVPVMVKENGTNLVDYEYINSISEQNGIGLFEALSTISQSNGLDSLNISIDEGDAITIGEQFNPELMVVRPISEDSYEYQFCEAVLESFINEEIDLDTLDEALLSEGMTNKAIHDLIGDKRREEERDRFGGLINYNKLSDMDKDKFGKIGDRWHNIEKEALRRNGLPENYWHAKYNDRTYADAKAGDSGYGINDVLFRGNDGRLVVKSKGMTGKKVKPNSKGDISSSDNDDTTKNTANGTNNADIPDEKKSNVPATVSSPSTSSGNGGGLIARPSNSVLGGGSSGSDKSKYLKYGAAAVGGAALAGSAWYAYKKYKNQPKSVIGKRIAALRQIYAKFMKRAQSAKDNGIAAKLKKVAAHVLKVVDKLLGYLQNKAG